MQNPLRAPRISAETKDARTALGSVQKSLWNLLVLHHDLAASPAAVAAWALVKAATPRLKGHVEALAMLRGCTVEELAVFRDVVARSSASPAMTTPGRSRLLGGILATLERAGRPVAAPAVTGALSAVFAPDDMSASAVRYRAELRAAAVRLARGEDAEVDAHA